MTSPHAGYAHSVSVLLVEESPREAALIRAALAAVGAGTAVHPWFHVRVVKGTREAIQVLRASLRIPGSGNDGRTPAMPVVLLELNVRGGRGIEALRELHEAVPDAPIVVLTTLDDDGVALEALRSGAQDYLVKSGADGETIVRAVRHAIARKRAEELAARTQWLAGIGETAIAIRHEVNNPLQALMLNVELLPAAAPDERAEIERAVLDAARRIAEVLKRLERVQQPRSVTYVGAERMLDLGS